MKDIMSCILVALLYSSSNLLAQDYDYESSDSSSDENNNESDITAPDEENNSWDDITAPEASNNNASYMFKKFEVDLSYKGETLLTVSNDGETRHISPDAFQLSRCNSGMQGYGNLSPSVFSSSSNNNNDNSDNYPKFTVLEYKGKDSQGRCIFYDPRTGTNRIVESDTFKAKKGPEEKKSESDHSFLKKVKEKFRAKKKDKDHKKDQ